MSVRAASWDPGKSIPSPWVFLIWGQPGWQHKVKFFLLSECLKEERAKILPKWSTAVEFGVQARLSFWKAGWFFKCFVWQNRLVPEEVHSLSSPCHSAQRKCLSVHVKSWPQGYSASSAGFYSIGREPWEDWQSASSVTISVRIVELKNFRLLWRCWKPQRASSHPSTSHIWHSVNLSMGVRLNWAKDKWDFSGGGEFLNVKHSRQARPDQD